MEPGRGFAEPGRAPVALQGPAALVLVPFRPRFLAGCIRAPGPCSVSWKVLAEGRLRGPRAQPRLPNRAVWFAILGQGRRGCFRAQ